MSDCTQGRLPDDGRDSFAAGLSPDSAEQATAGPYLAHTRRNFSPILLQFEIKHRPAGELAE